jgi:hypothetical protein
MEDLHVLAAGGARYCQNPCLKRSLKLGSRFNQPAVAERHQKNRIDLGIKLLLAGRDE